MQERNNFKAPVLGYIVMRKKKQITEKKIKCLNTPKGWNLLDRKVT